MPIDLLDIAPSRRGGFAHRGEQSHLWIEQRSGVEELRNLVRGELLPPTRERLEIDVAGPNDHLGLEEDSALLEIDPGVQGGRMRVALGALHGLVRSGKSADLHLKVKSLEAEHPLARLFQQGGRIGRRGATCTETDDDRQTSGETTRRRNAGVQLPLRIRSSPTRRVIFCASSHSSKGRT